MSREPESRWERPSNAIDVEDSELPVRDHPTPPEGDAGSRDDAWLADRVRLLWEVHFKDAPRGYPIVTRFSSRARYRFGSIAARNGATLILVNRLFANPFVPGYVVDATLAHELCHYVHGFGSGLPKLYAEAHRGGVVDQELERRGLGEISARADRWREAHWADFYAEQCSDLVARRESRASVEESRWRDFLQSEGGRTEAELRARQQRIVETLRRSGTPLKHVPPVTWLAATLRQTSPSYWVPSAGRLNLHGLLRDRRVPDGVIDFELTYWLIRLSVGSRWPQISAVLERSGLAEQAQAALTWRRQRWNAFRTRNHPLR